MILATVDHFDAVTASHGMEVAHEALMIVGGRISDALRIDDAMERCADDGFAILWKGGVTAPDITDVASRIAAKFDTPIMTSGGQLAITVSIGIASATGPDCATVSPLTLQRKAQSAVMSAQRRGRGQVAIFDEAVQDQAIRSYETECKLRTALSDERLRVAYQPIINLHSGVTVCVEALARWNDPMLGPVDPSTFIPIAEESGLIGELGQAVSQQAISQASRWNHLEGLDPTITINLSNRQLLDPTLIPSITAMLDQYDLKPQNVCFEITESVVMSDVAASMTILGLMKDMGLQLAIDDFGTGYSSLSYLRRLPVDILKIDQSFVQSIYNRDDRVITKAIIDLAHTLGMTTVAEGVETRLQLEVLSALQCDMAQGFYLHPPTEAHLVDFSPFKFETTTSNPPAAFPHSIGLR